jgi:hypothetical protein
MAFTDALQQSVHANAERAQERGYTPEQVYQTAAYGQEYPDPKGDPAVGVFKLNSIATPGTRRKVVINKQIPQFVTVYPREPIPEEAPKRQDREAITKKRQKEQLARKRARSRGEQS